MQDVFSFVITVFQPIRLVELSLVTQFRIRHLGYWIVGMKFWYETLVATQDGFKSRIDVIFQKRR